MDPTRPAILLNNCRLRSTSITFPKTRLVMLATSAALLLPRLRRRLRGVLRLSLRLDLLVPVLLHQVLRLRHRRRVRLV